jgi:hypothetical protein
VNDGDARQEVVIKLVALALQYNGGVEREQVSDVSIAYPSYAVERERLLASLSQCRPTEA